MDRKFKSWSLLSKSVVTYFYMKYSIMLSKKEKLKLSEQFDIVMFMLMYLIILIKKERLENFFCVYRQKDFIESLTVVS